MVEIWLNLIIWNTRKMCKENWWNNFIIYLGYKDYFVNQWLDTSDVTVRTISKETKLHLNSTVDWCISLIDTGECTMTVGRLQRVMPLLGN